MRRKRAGRRFLKKLPAEICAEGISLRGTTVRISDEGLFIRVQKSFNEGTPVDVLLSLPDGTEAALKGTVKYARTIDFMPRQNGMGIELTEADDAYTRFLQSLKED